MREFTASVLSCEEKKGQYMIVLDRTAFYPEGGGQGADRGVLGSVNVLDVHEKGDEIVHYCDGPLEVGSQVKGMIDWDLRFDHMQQHSGEHIVSGMICSRFNCSNIGFHMGEEIVTIDYDAEISEEELRKLEADANRYIWEGHDICIQWPDAGELKALDYRSKKELTGDVRIVSFPGADMCACCGTHVMNSAEVGLVKLISVKRFKGGSRIEMAAGKRALNFLNMNYENNKAISVMLSAKLEETPAAVERLNDEMRKQAAVISGLEEEIFEACVSAHTGENDVLIVRGPMSPVSVRKLCDALGNVCSGEVRVFAGTDGAWNYAVRTKADDMKSVIGAMNKALSGRGGGRDGFAQGSAGCTEAAIREYFK